MTSRINYGKCNIYKISNTVNNKVFFDVSVQRPSKRLSQIKKDAILYPNRNENNKSINDIGGDNFKIDLIRVFSCSNRNEMKQYFNNFQLKSLNEKLNISFNPKDDFFVKSEVSEIKPFQMKNEKSKTNAISNGIYKIPIVKKIIEENQNAFQIGGNKENNNKLKIKNENLLKKISHLIDEGNLKQSKHETRVNVLNKEIDKLKSVIENHNKYNTKLTTDNKNLSERIDIYNKNIFKKVDKNDNEKINELQTTIINLNNNFDKHKSINDQNIINIDKLNKENIKSQDKIKELNKIISNHKEIITNKDAEISKVKNECNDNYSLYMKLKKQYDDLKLSIDQDKQPDNNKDNINELIEKYNKVKINYAIIKKALKEQKKQYDLINQKYSNESILINDIDKKDVANKIKKYTTLCDKLQNDNEDLKIQLSCANKKLLYFQSSDKKIVESYNELSSKHNGLIESNNKLNDSNNKLQKKYIKIVKSNNKLNEKINVLSSKSKLKNVLNLNATNNVKIIKSKKSNKKVIKKNNIYEGYSKNTIKLLKNFDDCFVEHMETLRKSEQSLYIYFNQLRRLNKNIFNNDIFDIKLFVDNSDKVLKYIKSIKSDCVRQSLSVSLCYALKYYKYDKSVMTEFQEYKNEITKQRFTVKKRPKNKKNKEIFYKDLVKKRDRLIKKFINEEYETPYKPQKKITDRKNIKLMLILSFFTTIPPVRNEDLFTLKLDCNDTNKNDNILCMDHNKMICRKYKTSESHGTRTMKIPEELQQIIKFYCNKYNITSIDQGGCGWLFPNIKRDNHCNGGSFGSFCIRTIGIGNQKIRSLYVSDVAMKQTKKERERTADIMGHNISTGYISYSKYNDS